MDYKKIYNQLVAKAKPRGLDKSKHEGYFETHHIVPRCMGGGDEDENLVMLTAREHVIAHLLLWKVYPYVQGVVYAAHMMTVTKGGGRVPTRILATLREDFSRRASMRTEGAGLGRTRYTDISGEVYGRLTVKSFHDWHILPDGARRSKWLCECDCGKEVVVARTALITGYTVSCGCYHAEKMKEVRGKWNVSKRTYAAYTNMVTRCYSPSHKSNHNFVKYGINVCEEWMSDDGVHRFVEDMGEAPEGLCLIRIDPMGDFCKENCLWVTKSEASRSMYKFPREKKGVTGVTGVTISKRSGNYVAKMQVGGKYLSKEFSTLERAIAKRKEWEEEYRVERDE